MTIVVEASAIVQLSQQQTWEPLEGDEMRRMVERIPTLRALGKLAHPARPRHENRP